MISIAQDTFGDLGIRTTTSSRVLGGVIVDPCGCDALLPKRCKTGFLSWTCCQTLLLHNHKRPIRLILNHSRTKGLSYNV